MYPSIRSTCIPIHIIAAMALILALQCHQSYWTFFHVDFYDSPGSEDTYMPLLITV